MSRFSWQLPQTFIGHSYSQITNVFYNRVKSVSYFGGATVLDVTNLIWDGDDLAVGVTLGNYINGIDISNNPFETNAAGNPTEGAMLLRHEYGHYIQSQRNGFLFLPKYGIPSAITSGWTEDDANFRSDTYFNRHYGVTRNFNFLLGGYPTDYRPINAKWWEYGLFIATGPLLTGSGIIGLLNLNNGR
jgi:hypothetical protein